MTISICHAVTRLEAHEELIVFLNGAYVIYDHINDDYYYEVIINRDSISEHIKRHRAHNIFFRNKNVLYRVKGK